MRPTLTRSPLACALLALAVGLSTPSLAAPALSDAVTAPRPAGGEYFGLYLMQKKIGYLFTDLKLSPKGDQATSITEMHLRVTTGSSKTSAASPTERHMKVTRVYESKPGGRLLSLTVEQTGDGGEQTLEATATPAALKVVRTRPNSPTETFTLKAAKETVEDADQARVALKRNAKVEGTLVDETQDLEQYKWTTTVGEPSTFTLHGVSVKVRKTITVSEKDKVPFENLFDEKGKILESRMGPTIIARAEPQDVAKRVDTVEVFALTRVVLPRPMPPTARGAPSKVVMVMSGLPAEFRTNTYRQAFKPLDGDKVQVTVTASPPSKLTVRPAADPNGGANLKSTLTIESDNAEIKALAKKVAGDEKDAWTAAKKVSRWVYKNMQSDYGTSSDRATDVLKTMKGDCTEHSLLTVALLRSLGIPSKRVDGVIYVMNDDMVPALYWHEWVEAWVGEWTQLDPTFGQDVADATHFQAGEEAAAEIMTLMGVLKVHSVE